MRPYMHNLTSKCEYTCSEIQQYKFTAEQACVATRYYNIGNESWKQKCLNYANKCLSGGLDPEYSTMATSPEDPQGNWHVLIGILAAAGILLFSCCVLVHYRQIKDFCCSNLKGSKKTKEGLSKSYKQMEKDISQDSSDAQASVQEELHSSIDDTNTIAQIDISPVGLDNSLDSIVIM